MDLYHVLNRGVDKRRIVMSDSDRLRFVHSLFVFNDHNNVDANHRRRGWNLERAARTPLVNIHAWCLMDNHYHLLLSPVRDDARKLSLFVKKLNMGYAKYFNEKHNRSGALWQGKYKKILIQRDAHYQYIPHYIHLNPLDYTHPEWREGKVKNSASALNTLAAYRWSSLQDYLGKPNFSSLIERSLLDIELGSPKALRHTMAEVITDLTLSTQGDGLE